MQINGKSEPNWFDILLDKGKFRPTVVSIEDLNEKEARKIKKKQL
jgi:hypothetical protein